MDIDNQHSSTTECMAWKNAQHVYCGCTGEFAVLLGVDSVGDIVGKTDAELMPGIDAERNRDIENEVLESQSSQSVRGYLSTREGIPLSALVRLSAIPADVGGNVCIELAVVDHIVNAPVQRASPLETCKPVLDALVMPLLLFDKTRFFYLNAACANLLGYKVDDIKTRDDFIQCLDPVDRSRIKSTCFEGDNNTLTSEPIEFKVLRKDGKSLLIEAQVQSADWFGLTIHVMTLSDISDLKLVEAALNQANDILHDSKRHEWIPDGAFKGLDFTVMPEVSGVQNKFIEFLNKDEMFGLYAQTLAEALPLGLLLLDELTPVFANQEAARLFDFDSVAEMMASGSIASRLGEQEVQRFQTYSEARKAGRPSPSEYDFVVHNRNKKQAFTLHAVESKFVWNNKPLAMILVFISNRFGMNEQRLDTIEARYQSFLAIASDFRFELDELLNISFISGAQREPLQKIFRQLHGKGVYEGFQRRGVDSQTMTPLMGLLREYKPFREHRLSFMLPPDERVILSVTGRPMISEKGQFLGYQIAGRDVTEEFQEYQELHHQAGHDALTGLVNRREFERQVSEILGAVRGRKATHALCYLDLDRFKIVNDQCGHLAGDELLRRLSERMSEHLRSSDTLARLGGDEFGVLIRHCTLSEAEKVANQLCDAVKQFHFLWKENSFNVGVSIGVVPISSSSGDLETVLDLADKACYKVKKLGRGQVITAHEESVPKVAGGITDWSNEFASGQVERRFMLMKQKIQPLNGSVDFPGYFELLLRVLHEQGEFMPPSALLSIAQRLNRLIDIDRWVFDHLLVFLTDGREQEDISLCTMNLSQPSVADLGFLNHVLVSIDQSSVPPSMIGFEISEATAVTNLARTTYFIDRLQSLGCRFILDNFGSGLSSFSYLKKLPVNYLKISGNLIRSLDDDPVSEALVQSINDIAQALGVQTIGENVERAEQLEKLKALNIDYAQGFYVSKPTPIKR
ncbi:MAG: EAL domain-containing protein [Gammaproteobacteria bacterium]|nr:EAL domain-containing protein [Gammaproteobacteria bacterium]